MEVQTFLQQKILDASLACTLRLNEPMRLHTSFHIGGNAEVMAFPETAEQLSQLLKWCASQGIIPAILGAGTNVLAPDEGVGGVVICLKDSMDGMYELDGHRIAVMSGVTLTRAAVYAANLGLSGLEFAHGIPGTVGGGIYMNAGAYGGELSQICESVDVMYGDGNIRTLTSEQMAFSYRRSCLQEQEGIVVRVVFQLQPAPSEQIRSKMKELMGKRSSSQPLDLPSAGSAFKRPAGGYAAALIDQAGLKGFRIGGAAVSEKHAGFVVNLGGATAADVRSLLTEVSRIVLDRSGIRLEPEIRIW